MGCQVYVGHLVSWKSWAALRHETNLIYLISDLSHLLTLKLCHKKAGLMETISSEH